MDIRCPRGGRHTPTLLLRLRPHQPEILEAQALVEPKPPYSSRTKDTAETSDKKHRKEKKKQRRRKYE